MNEAFMLLAAALLLGLPFILAIVGFSVGRSMIQRIASCAGAAVACVLVLVFLPYREVFEDVLALPWGKTILAIIVLGAVALGWAMTAPFRYPHALTVAAAIRRTAVRRGARRFGIAGGVLLVLAAVFLGMSSLAGAFETSPVASNGLPGTSSGQQPPGHSDKQPTLPTGEQPTLPTGEQPDPWAGLNDEEFAPLTLKFQGRDTYTLGYKLCIKNNPAPVQVAMSTGGTMIWTRYEGSPYLALAGGPSALIDCLQAMTGKRHTIKYDGSRVVMFDGTTPFEQEPWTIAVTVIADIVNDDGRVTTWVYRKIRSIRTEHGLLRH